MSAASAGRRPRAHAAPAPERTVYLHPGKIYAAAGPATVTTILGSCVAVCLFDVQAGVGGINHYLLPHWAGGADASARYGNVALQALLERVVSLGSRPGGLQAKVFGGACVLEAFRGDGGGHLGQRNADLASAFLRERGIPLAASDTGGHRGRKLVFRTDDGTALVRVL